MELPPLLFFGAQIFLLSQLYGSTFLKTLNIEFGLRGFLSEMVMIHVCVSQSVRIGGVGG